ncbi:GNAT family N-acetyltransferase [Devosia sp.]|uniref:GNAT family N-acetyltransferase n=1 Tax=Devosia sp. TaxID=1871048 RepID=UPI001ACD1615|nr:GNAT family N-acetyltransferase [Devosia sp.]MBN9334205.1 GNAT family N-acetyltransferase [Devosia sp.]
MAQVLRLRKALSGSETFPAMPEGLRHLPTADAAPIALHALLADAYTNGFGSVPAFAQWWPSITSDEEYDPALLVILADQTGHPAALALCWNSGFIKDLAVAPPWRGRGVGDALLATVFATFAERGFRRIDLKVMAANSAAIRLYRRAGMEEAPL